MPLQEVTLLQLVLFVRLCATLRSKINQLTNKQKQTNKPKTQTHKKLLASKQTNKQTNKQTKV